MSRPAARSIAEYLKQLREALAGEDPALIQDALYDAEEYLRAEIAVHPEKSEADVLELIGSTYGAPDEVAAAYRDTEAKVKAALQTPAPRAPATPSLRRSFFGVFLDPRAYLSLFYMLLAGVTGILYFTFVVTGLSLSAGLAVLIIGVPFFLVFIAMARVISLGEGRLLETVSGERMPRRPLHPGPPAAGWWSRIGAMLADARTWTTLGYLVVMLPLGILYFVLAIVGLSVGVSFTAAPIVDALQRLGLIDNGVSVYGPGMPGWALSPVGGVLLFLMGILIMTGLMHLARGIGRTHARLAKSLLAKPA
jgi:uncharacterized membrane protein